MASRCCQGHVLRGASRCCQGPLLSEVALRRCQDRVVVGSGIALLLRLHCQRQLHSIIKVTLSSRLRCCQRQGHVIIKVTLPEASLHRCQVCIAIKVASSLEAASRYCQDRVVRGSVRSSSRSHLKRRCHVVEGSVVLLSRRCCHWRHCWRCIVVEVAPSEVLLPCRQGCIVIEIASLLEATSGHC